MAEQTEAQGTPSRLIALPEVLERIPVGRATFLRLVNEGIYPKPVNITPRRVAWRSQDIDQLIHDLSLPDDERPPQLRFVVEKTLAE